MNKSFAVIFFLLLFFLGNALADSSIQSIQYPLEAEANNLWREFGYLVESGTYKGKYHTAQDFAGEGGTPVYAVADGVISYSGAMDGYGWLIIIDHPTLDVYSLYGHLSTRRWKKLTGSAVRIGEHIGYLADDDEDGGSWKPHLHLGIRKGQKDDYPRTGDERWTAGYTSEYPTNLGWVEPVNFIEDHQEGSKNPAPSPPDNLRCIGIKY